MKKYINSKLSLANKAVRDKEYETALAIYNDLLVEASEPILTVINNNRDYIIKKIELNNNKIKKQKIKTEVMCEPEIFNSEFYLSKYPDLRVSSISPYGHYVEHGRLEGRLGIFDFDLILNKGIAKYDKYKNTIIIVCHEASRTGAPILGLRIVESLSLKYNIIVWLGKTGPLVSEYKKHAFAIVDHYPGFAEVVWGIKEIQKKYRLNFAITNSAVTSKFSSAFFELKIPSIALVHEYADYMSSEIIQILATANRVVFPAEGVKKSAENIFIKQFLSEPRQTSVKNQGICIPPLGGDGVIYTKEIIKNKINYNSKTEQPIVVLGCGYVQIRKGVEYFIQAAQICKKIYHKPMIFIWVGGGFEPEKDFGYSIWLKSQIINSEIEDELFFFEETKDLSPFFEMSDVFFLSSRLDPFPNVAIDSVTANVPIVAFNRATGFSEFIEKNPSVGVVVPYLDVYAAANAIIKLSIKSKKTKTVIEQKLIDDGLSFNNYIEFLERECLIAINNQKLINEEVLYLENKKLMTSGFHASGIPDFEKNKNWHYENTVLSNLTEEYMYVSGWSRGIIRSKSKFGFSDQIAENILNSESKTKEKITPLARWAETEENLFTHYCHNLSLELNKSHFHTKFKILIHIHVYYHDELKTLLGYLNNITCWVCYCITTTSEKIDKVREIIEEFFGGEFGKIKIIYKIVPNKGRDMGPFIMVMKEYKDLYDLFGHFHIKGTKQMLQKQVKQWQKFLYETLIGLDGKAALEIINKFENENNLGFVFQEDPCLPSWGSNYKIAERVASELSLDLLIPDIPEYPTGNMFWVRSSAFKSLFKKDWQWSDFPSEPIPYDGSILHAVERLFPVMCLSSGFKWMTVRNKNAIRYQN